jgi:putative phosphonate metabolism protein
MRCAVYFAPPQDDPLAVAAARWLGRDAYTGERIEGVETAGIVANDRAYLTAAPRRYGFHGTLKAPFKLAEGLTLTALGDALDRFAAGRHAIVLPEMQVGLLDDFYALMPARPSRELNDLASAIVTDLDVFRAPLEEADFARRGRAHLGDRALANLLTWGYPFIFDEFRFHMTLTGPVPAIERDHVRDVLGHHFGELATAPLVIGQLAVFIEPEPHAPLVVHSTHRLALEESRMIA